MFARIENNIVKEIINSEKKPFFHKSIKLVECNSYVKERYIYDEDTNEFSEPDYSITNEEKITLIKLQCNKRIEKIMPIWMISRELSGGKVISQAIKDEAQRLRVKSNEVEVIIAGGGGGGAIASSGSVGATTGSTSSFGSIVSAIRSIFTF